MSADTFEFATLAAAVKARFLASAQAHVPVASGALRDSLSIKESASLDATSFELWGALHGKFVITGTAPHDIFPVRAQALFWPEAAHPYASVHHPGTRPNDFRPAIVADMQPILRQLGQQHCQLAIANIRRRTPSAA